MYKPILVVCVTVIESGIEMWSHILAIDVKHASILPTNLIKLSLGTNHLLIKTLNSLY